MLATLKQALVTGHQPQIFHSDQGNEFMAQRCTDYLEQHDIQISVSDVAAPWQNGYIESFYWPIHYYNHYPIHTALKMPPATYALKIDSDNCLHKLGT